MLPANVNDPASMVAQAISVFDNVKAKANMTPGSQAKAITAAATKGPSSEP